MDKHDSKKKVIVVGAGSYYLAHQELIKDKITAYCYSDKEHIFEYVKDFNIKAPIIFVNQVEDLDFDYILIATTGKAAEDLTVKLLSLGIELHKIQWINSLSTEGLVFLLTQKNNNISAIDYITHIFLKRHVESTEDHLDYLCKKINKLEMITSSLMRPHENKTCIHEVNILGLKLLFRDALLSMTVQGVVEEINSTKEYCFDSIPFKEGDIVIDIGGNVGIVSIYLAKKYPFLKIVAFEPVKANYDNFIYNMELNGISQEQITVLNLAVTKDGRDVTMNYNCTNTGGSAIQGIFSTLTSIISKNTEMSNTVGSITLEEIFDKYCSSTTCRLLKIDCEGSEYEILYNTNKEILSQVDHLIGEFHENIESGLEKANDLLEYCKKYIRNVNVMFCQQ